ncbi:MAG TPA: thiamine pyrophosphate-binding protein, partial [Woeseiaceae bacterium]|nr:thiamine pyrophosphate-binding protein [Woeseiaceae bacterium]
MSSIAEHATHPPAERPSAPAKALRGADALLYALEAEGVDLIFGYPGGAIMPVYDALVDSGIRHILVRHE